MDHDNYSDAYISGILNSVTSIAIIGASANEVRPSYFVAKYMVAKGYDVIAVNPGQAGGTIVGQPVVATLGEIEEPVDMIDVFRGSNAVPGITDEILSLSWKPKVIWMQLTVRHDGSAARLEEAGIKVVMNRCPKIEYARLSGEISWNGVNSRQISAKKPIMRSGFQSMGIRKR